MKKKDLDQLRLKPWPEIAKEILRREIDLFKLASGGANPREGANLRRDLAQLKTILNEIAGDNKKGSEK